MSALNTFAEKVTKEGMSNFELSQIRFSIVKRNKFLFVASSSNKIKTKAIIIPGIATAEILRKKEPLNQLYFPSIIPIKEILRKTRGVTVLPGKINANEAAVPRKAYAQQINQSYFLTSTA